MTFLQALIISMSIVLANVVIRWHKRYKNWRDNPERVRVAVRDWQGRYVADLKIKRVERFFVFALIAFFVVAAFFSFVSLGLPSVAKH